MAAYQHFIVAGGYSVITVIRITILVIVTVLTGCNSTSSPNGERMAAPDSTNPSLPIDNSIPDKTESINSMTPPVVEKEKTDNHVVLEGSADDVTEHEPADETKADEKNDNAVTDNAADNYTRLCLDCHGPKGLNPVTLANIGNNVETVIEKISQDMPVGNTGECIDDCAVELARYIIDLVDTHQQPIENETNEATNTDSGHTAIISCDINERRAQPQKLRLLTRDEYQATIEDLTGIDIPLSDEFAVEPRVNGFSNNANALVVTPRHMFDYLQAAEKIAVEMIKSPVSHLVQCDKTENATLNAPLWLADNVYWEGDQVFYENQVFEAKWWSQNNPPTEGDPWKPLGVGSLALTENEVVDVACAQEFIAGFGKKAFRRPLTEAEKQNYLALFSNDLTDGDFSVGIGLAVQAMLISPHFLYRFEIGSGDELRLNNYEVASYLSYLFWGTMPDQTLFDAADNNQLQTLPQVKSQMIRMLSDQKANRSIDKFFSEWLTIDRLSASFKDPEIYPNFTDEIREAMIQEAKLFGRDLVREKRTFQALYQPDHLFANSTLAAFYQMEYPTNAQGFVKLPTTDSRGGLMSLGALMASLAHPNESSPIKRGVFVRRRLMCHNLPAPPQNIDATPPALDLSLTTRERFAQHTDDPVCADCHQYIDGIGFGLEGYDGIGAFRQFENDLFVDQSGAVQGLESMGDQVHQPFSGANELGALLAETHAARACTVMQYNRFAHGGSETEDHCTTDKLAAFTDSSNNSFWHLFMSVADTELFFNRTHFQ